MPNKEEKILEKEAKKLAKETKKSGKIANDKPVYIICPKCDLNHIIKSDKYCTICKASLGLIDKSVLIPDDESEIGEKLCPTCSITYIAEDETICFLCAKEKEREAAVAEWEPDVATEPEQEQAPEQEEEEITIVLSEDDNEEEEEETVDYSDLYKEPDDLDYTVNEDDFLDSDEDDEEDDDEDDEDY